MNEHILLSEVGGVLNVVINRPQKYNAISDAMWNSFRAAVDLFGERRDLRVMLIQARGKYFSAGAELNPDTTPDFKGSTLDGRHWFRRKWHALSDELEAIEKPIVVAHQGVCLGGALEFSLSCDFRLASTSATYGLPEIDIGALPGSGGISRLVRVVGPHWARWLVMAGEHIDAERALAIGMIHALYPDDSLEREANAFCQRLAAKPYEVMGLAKLSIELATDLDRGQARNVERIANSLLFTGSEHKTLLNQFLERQAEKHRSRT